MKPASKIYAQSGRQYGKGAAFKVARQLRSVGRQEVSIIELLEWAFQREKASISFGHEFDRFLEPCGYGVEYKMLKQAELGCRIDGGGSSPCHPDADIVTDALAALPEPLGGRRMAVQIADFARAGSVPSLLEDEVPRCEPVEWRRSKHGEFAHREYYTGPGRWPANRLGKSDGYACPVVYSVTSDDIARARRGYLCWWLALLELRVNLQTCDPLTSFVVNDDMPPKEPWKKRT